MIEEIGRGGGGEHGAGQVSVSVPATGGGPGLPGWSVGGRCGPLRLGGIFLRRAPQPAHAEGVPAGGAAVPGLVRGAGGRAGDDHARPGRPVPRRPGRLARQAEPRPGGVARLLRPAGQPACRHPESGRVGEGRQGYGGRGQDAGDHHRAGPDAAGVGRYRPCRRPAGPGDPGDAGLYRLPGRGGRQAARCRTSSTTGRSTCCGSRRRAARAGKSRCGTTWRGISWPISRRRASRARPRIRRCSGRRNGRSRKLTARPLTTERICGLVKRRLKDAGLPSRLSPHCFRVTAITDLLDAGRAAGGRAVPGRACRAADDGPLRPAAEAGDAEHRRADFDLMAASHPTSNIRLAVF